MFALVGLVGFFSSMFMGVTVVGVCRYGTRYQEFFNLLKTLGTLASIKEMARIYLKILNKFLGPNVGFKQDGVLQKTKFFGMYIEHLLLLYWVSVTILVLAFRPAESPFETTNSFLLAAAFVMLLTINVASDAVSLLWTKRCIALLVIPSGSLTLKKLVVVLAQDILVAVILMVLVQLVSSGLYAVQIGRPGEFFKYMFDFRTALKPYVATDPNFSEFQFPGQLVITCSTYIPSFAFYLTCLAIVCLMPFYNFAIWVLGIFNVDQGMRSAKCTQVGFIGSLVGVGGFAMGSGALFVSTWMLIRPS
jgi:hypothetical protein